MSPAIAPLGRSLFLIKVWCLVVVVERLTKGETEGCVFQVCDLESHPLCGRCRVRDRWKGVPYALE